MTRHSNAHHQTALAAHLAPVFVEAVTLAVNDIAGVAAFYRDVLGLNVLAESAVEVTLGSGDVPFLKLLHDAHARLRPADQPGLFHTAFLLPQRRDLGQWLHFALDTKLPLEGLSDHLVSEAAYLSDPEGNGIEIYVDRPMSVWPRKNGAIEMGTSRMDVRSVMAEAEGMVTGPRYQTPAGTRIGHVHLSVAKLEHAAETIGAVLGMAKKCSYPQADFYASGEYHHHIAANTWQTNPAKSYAESFTGLRKVTLQAPAAADREALALRMTGAGARKDGNDIVLAGPSGIPIGLEV